MNFLFILLLPFIIFLAAAPLVATILGWVAVSQIRRSGGKLYGMGLAVFDGLLFPLLALDVMIFGCSLLVARLIPLDIAVLLLAALLVGILADWLIIRSVWRAVQPQSLGPAGPAESSPGRNHRLVWVGVLACVIVLIVGPPVTYLAQRQGDAAVSEVELREPDANGIEMLNLDRGVVVRRPDDLGLKPVEEQLAWARSTGVNLRANHSGLDDRQLDTPMVNPVQLFRIDDTTWDKTNTRALKHALAASAPGVAIRASGTVRSYSVPADKMPVTFVFQTAGGTIGLLQLTEKLYTEDGRPDGFRLRFRRLGVVPASPEDRELAASAQTSGSDSSTADVWTQPAVPVARVKMIGVGMILIIGLLMLLIVIGIVVGIVLVFRKGRTAKTIGIILIVLGLGAIVILVVLAGGLLFFRARTHSRQEVLREQVQAEVAKLTRIQASASTAASWGPLTFGPVMEQALSQNTERDVCYIDLDQNRTFTPPREDLSSDKLSQWIISRGIDALAVTKEAGAIQGLVGWDMRLRQVGPDNWENITSASLVAQLESVPQLNEAVMRGENTLPATFLFQTREGNCGVLQITGFTDDPRAVQFRFKLLRFPEPARLADADIFQRAVTAGEANPDGVVGFRFREKDLVAVPSTITAHFSDPAKIGFTPELKDWMKANRIDLLLHLGPKSYDVLTLDLRHGFAGQPTEWETIEPDRAAEVLRKLEQRNTVPGTSISSGHGYHDGSSSIEVFSTQGGLTGLYQLRGLDDLSGRGVMIRWRPLQSPGRQQSGMESIVDAFLKHCAAAGVSNGQEMFAALGMGSFIAEYGNGQKAMREHHDKLPPVMQAAISATSGEPLPEFADYVQKAHIESTSELKPQAILLLNTLGISHGVPQSSDAAQFVGSWESQFRGKHGGMRIDPDGRCAFTDETDEIVMYTWRLEGQMLIIDTGGDNPLTAWRTGDTLTVRTPNDETMVFTRVE